MAEKVSRQERISRYREVSGTADYLADCGDIAGALKALEAEKKRAEEAGDRGYAAFFTAEIYGYRDCDYAKAVQMLTSVIEEAKNDHFLLLAIGIYMSLGARHDEAIKWIDKALEVNPKDPRAMRNKGVTLSKKDQHDEAMKWYDKALEVNPKDYNAMRNKGVDLAAKGQHDEAIKWIDKALEVNPKNYDAMRNRGAVLLKNGQEDEAIKWFDRALEVNPKDYDAMRNKGVALSKKGQYDEAMKWYDKALEVNPKSHLTMREIGTALAQKGQQEEGIKWLNKALEVNPKDGLAYRNRSVAEYNKGDKERALLSICTAVKLEPSQYKDVFTFICSSIGRDADAEWKKLFPRAKSEDKGTSPRQVSELQAFIQGLRKAYSSQAGSFLTQQREEEAKKDDFLKPKSDLSEKMSLFLVLRRWNSYTPSIPTLDVEKSIGGGYYLRHNGKGIVIDPGYDFIENFYRAGGRLHDIDVIVVTHSHNDHTAELETLISLVHEYNDRLKKAQKEERFVDVPRKKVVLYVNAGAFMKFSGLLDLRGRDDVEKVWTLGEGNEYTVDETGDIKLGVVVAYHNEVVARGYSVGLLFDLKSGKQKRRVVFTSDTGLLPLDLAQEEPMPVKNYEKEVWKCYERGGQKVDVLVVHIGAIKPQELEAKYSDPATACYPNHLGIIGTARVISQVKPKLAIISEFGQEMKGFRCELATGIEHDVIGKLPGWQNDAALKKLRIVPGDISLACDIMGEKFCDCVSCSWVAYGNIAFDYGQEPGKQDDHSAIYYFDKANHREFLETQKRHPGGFIEKRRVRRGLHFKEVGK